jgi:hypothetical protein
VRLAGKRPGGRWLSQLGAIGSLLFLAEEDSGKTFLVDTGTGTAPPLVQCLSAASRPQRQPTLPARTTLIPAFGTVQFCLCLSGQPFVGDFVQAAVN